MSAAAAAPTTGAALAAQPAAQQGWFGSHFGHHGQPAYAQPATSVAYGQPAYTTGQAMIPTGYTSYGASASGYQSYMTAVGRPGYTGVQLNQQTYIAADTNHDGKVDADELKKATLQYQAIPTTYTTSLGANATGYQSYMHQVQAPAYTGMQLSQAAYFAADTNHDGKVSAAELQYAQAHYQPTNVVTTTTGQHTIEFSNIKVTEGELARSGKLDKADPYVYFYLNLPGVFHHKTGTTTVKKNNKQPDWTGEVVKLAQFEHPEKLVVDITVYDKDLMRDDKMGQFKFELGPLYSKGHTKQKIDNNLFAKDVYLEFDYTTTWGPEPPKPKKKSSKKKKAKNGGCC